MITTRSAHLLRLVVTAVAGIFPSHPAIAQSPLKAPQGWTGETIQLPPGFARDMTFKGVEHIRFAPGMFKPAAPDFFSYAFVFELKNAEQPDQKTLQREFLTYYRGLCNAVGGKRIPDLDVTRFTCALTPAQNPNNDDKTFNGTLSWIEPFQTLRPQTLHLEITTWSDEKKSFVFACVSPQKRDAEIWTQLRKILSDYIASHP